MTAAPGPADEASEPDDPDGLMNDQEMPTTDGEMASNTSEEVVPPEPARDTRVEGRDDVGRDDVGRDDGGAP